MATLIIELTAGLVKNLANRTKVDVTLKNLVGRLSIENREGDPRSIHRFTVSNAADLGCGGVGNLDKEQAAFVLAMSCSLANPNVLFTPLQPQQLPPSLKQEKPQAQSQPQVVEIPGGKSITLIGEIGPTGSVSHLLITKLDLDEAQVFSIVDRLLNARIFDTAGRLLQELNILESIKRYGEALRSADALSCYKSLYNAFEKAVTTDGQDRKGNEFDNVASSLTGLTAAEIKNLREFNNRVKHPLRNNKDFSQLRAGEAQVPQLTQAVKKAADSAILARLSSVDATCVALKGCETP